MNEFAPTVTGKQVRIEELRVAFEAVNSSPGPEISAALEHPGDAMTAGRIAAKAEHCLASALKSGGVRLRALLRSEASGFVPNECSMPKAWPSPCQSGIQ